MFELNERVRNITQEKTTIFIFRIFVFNKKATIFMTLYYSF